MVVLKQSTGRMVVLKNSVRLEKSAQQMGHYLYASNKPFLIFYIKQRTSCKVFNTAALTKAFIIFILNVSRIYMYMDI